ncbi:hypothetical protein [Pseudomonas sp. dw_358]|uniref:maleate cis-trans isomerase family protein n=1 Tax=Pseudomonas sp. dw_358 TaxID=2720083 RepID=UPI001BD53F46|nr:hypothetical protein [Pseudomonas sp. dw_358]
MTRQPCATELVVPDTLDSPTQVHSTVGLLSMSMDRVGCQEFIGFIGSAPGLSLLPTRLPMSDRVTVAHLERVQAYLADAIRLLAPGSALDVVCLGCSAASVAIGIGKVHEAIWSVRPGVRIVTPVDAAITGLKSLGTRSIALIMPYKPPVVERVRAHIEEHGIAVKFAVSFNLDGDTEANRVSEVYLERKIIEVLSRRPRVDAILIGAASLRSFSFLSRLERQMGTLIISDNQALAWRCSGLINPGRAIQDHGRLCEQPHPNGL